MICKNEEQIQKMRNAGAATARALEYAESIIKVGVTTKYIDECVEKFIRDNGGVPGFKGYGGFPGSVCASVNDVVVHGIPSNYTLKDGDIISIDVGVVLDGYNGDAARTFAVGNVKKEVLDLIERTKNCFFKAVDVLKVGARIGDIGFAIQTYAESFGYGVVRELVGHGIGKHLHEDPQVPNYGKQNTLELVKENMCLAIEPMINLSTRRIYIESDGWTIKTADGKPSAHYENTVIVTKNGVEILTI